MPCRGRRWANCWAGKCAPSTRAPIARFICKPSGVAPQDLGARAIADGAACVLMTHDFPHNLEILKRVLPSVARYVGVLRPRRRTGELLEQLSGETLSPALAITPQQLTKWHAPVGFDLGSETPAEIALAIVAEIQKQRRAKSGQSLRELDAIH